MTFYGALIVLVVTIFFLNVMISASSIGPKVRTQAKIADGYHLVFEPHILHRIFLWLDVPFVYFFYLFVISVVEFLCCYTTATWYFSRKKKEAKVSNPS